MKKNTLITSCSAGILAFIVAVTSVDAQSAISRGSAFARTTDQSASASEANATLDCKHFLPAQSLEITIPCDRPPESLVNASSVSVRERPWAPSGGGRSAATLQISGKNASFARQQCSELNERAQLEAVTFEQIEAFRNGCR